MQGQMTRQTNFREWLISNTRVGDLVLTGSHDIASWVIRKGTKSDYSHAAVVSDPERFTEAYDRSMTFSEDDDGLYEVPFDEFAGRSSKLTRVRILRPSKVDPHRLSAAAAYMRAHSPSYPTLGALIIGSTKWTSGLAKRASRKAGRAAGHQTVRSVVSRFMERQVALTGDGPIRVHCAEFVYRLYLAAGTPIRLVKPVLAGPMSWLRPKAVGAVPNALSPFLKQQRRSQPGPWPAGPGSPRRWFKNGFFATEQLVDAATQRWTEQTKPDTADFVMPEDFTRADGLRHVADIDFERDDSTGLWRPDDVD